MKTETVPLRVKKYFESGSRKIRKVTPHDNYTLEVYFDSGEIRIFDLSEHLFGVFEALKDLHAFRGVFIDDRGNIAWDIDRGKEADSLAGCAHRIDICKDAVYLDSKPQ